MYHISRERNALIAENIFVSFGAKEILKGVALRLEQNKITGLLGRNGAGKSTMLRVIFGIQKADDLTLSINGIKTHYPYLVKGLLNYLPQQSFLPPARKMKQVLADYQLKAATVLHHFPELEYDLDKTASELSGGAERLWSVIILLLADTKYTLLDEPFSHIMPLHIERLKDLIKQQSAKKGILITDHMYRHILSLSDSLYLLKDGGSLLIKDKEDIVLHGYLRHLE